MSSDPFESPKFLIQNTRENIPDLYARNRAFLGKKPYVELTKFDSDTGDKIYILQMTEDVPDRIRHIATTALNDLRHALDQAVFACSRILNPKCGTNTYFPFASNPDDLETLWHPKKGRCRDVPPKIRPLLTSFEPYPTGNCHKGGNNMLRALGRLTGPNKHQVAIGLEASHSALFVQRMASNGLKSVDPRWNSAKNELELFRCAHDGEVNHNSYLVVFVAFGDAEVIGGKPIVPILDNLTGIVERIVLGIEAETRRIGLIL